MSNVFSYLNFIRLSNISRWDVKRLCMAKQYTGDSWVYLKDILSEYKKAIPKEKLLKDRIQIIAKINFAGELFLRSLDEISTFKSTLFEIPENCFIYSKINVRHGCSYYNKTGKTIAGTSEYPVFKINEKLVDGEYLHKILRTDYIKKYLSSKTTGFSKTRVQVDEFLNMQIPLPPIEKQREFVKIDNAKFRLAEEQTQQVKKLEDEIELLWINQLGLEFANNDQIKDDKIFLNLISLSQLSRWDIYNNTKDVRSYKYKFSQLKDFIVGKPLYGAGEKGVKLKSDTRYIRITDINEDGTLNDDFVSAQKVDEKYILEENDFLIARSGNTVGKTFLYKRIHGRCMYAGYLIRFRLNLEKIIPEYLLYYTKSKAYKVWISSNQRANAQPNINSEEFLNSPVLIPDLAEQKYVVRQIEEIRQQILNLKYKAEAIKIEARQQFEKELFG